MQSLIEAVEVSGIVAIRDMLLKKENPLRLESGEPSFDTPEHIKQAAIDALARNETHYVNSQGIVPLREALATKLARKNGIKANPDDILATNGGMHGLYSVFSSILNTGDEVIIPTPNWACCQWLVSMTGGKPVYVNLYEELDFRFNREEFEAAIGPRTKAILINSPHNPTGGILYREDYEFLLQLARKHHLYLVSDEAYEDIVWDEAHISPGSLVSSEPELEQLMISVFTFSKSYAMTGWRLGYVVCRNKEVMARMKKVVLYSANGVNSITQWAGMAAVSGPQDFLIGMNETFKKNRDILLAGLNQTRFLSMTYRPKGAFYLTPRISSDWPGFEGDRSDTAFVRYLIEKGTIGCTPGSIFGPGGVGFIRFSYACSTEMVQKAVERLVDLA